MNRLALVPSAFRALILMLPSLSVVALSACSTMKVDRDRLKAVKTVALVGFSVEQKLPNTGEGVLEAAMSSGDGQPMGMNLHPAEIAKPAQHASAMYDRLATLLQDRIHWKVWDRKTLTSHAAYSAFFKDKTRQPQMRPSVSGDNIKIFVPEGIVETFLLNSMGVDDRAMLLKALGVDAIAVATVKVDLIEKGGLKTLVGAGDYRTKSVVGFRVFDGEQSEPIWMDTYAVGQPSQEATGHVLGFADVSGLDRQAVSATDSAYEALISRYGTN